jgi:hypothetical protein
MLEAAEAAALEEVRLEKAKTPNKEYFEALYTMTIRLAVEVLPALFITEYLERCSKTGE